MTKSKTYNIEFEDLSQMDTIQKDSFLKGINDYLSHLTESEFLRFKGFKNRAVVNNKISIPSAKITLIEPSNEIFSNLTIKEDFYKLNGLYHSLITITDFPEYANFIGLQEFENYTIQFQKLSFESAKSLLETKRKILTANQNLHLTDYENDHALETSESLLNDLIEGTESLFKCECSFTLNAPDLNQLNEKTQDLINSLHHSGFLSQIEDLGLTSAFNDLNSSHSMFKRSLVLPTSYLAHLLPLKRDFFHSHGIEFHSLRDLPLYFNLFNEISNNFNLLISGLSGSGKSALTQKILLENINNGSKALILDKGKSFYKLTRYLGGEVLKESFNPLLYNSPTYLKEFIISVIPKGELNPKLEGKLFKFFKANSTGQFKNFKTLLNQLETLIPDLSLYFEELLPYFDNHQTIQQNNLLYVDLDDYPEKILPPLIIFLIESFKHLEGKRIMVFDECWNLLEKNTAYIGECFRTFRKFGASAIAITQNYSDFTDSPIGKTISNNSFTKILFNQENCPEFSDFDYENIKELNTIKGEYSEFYLKTPFNRKSFRYYQTPLEFELFRSDFSDLSEFESFYQQRKEVFDFQSIFHQFIGVKYENAPFNA